MKEIFKVLFALRNFLESRKLGDSINNDPVFAQYVLQGFVHFPFSR